MDKKEFALQKHKDWAGKIEVVTRCEMETPEDLSVASTPGVAEPCLEISRDVGRCPTPIPAVTTWLLLSPTVLLFWDWATTDPEAGMPVMEGKCALFKAFG